MSAGSICSRRLSAALAAGFLAFLSPAGAAQAPQRKAAASGGANLHFYTVHPCRAIDTRNPAGPFGGPALSANATRTFGVAGQCGTPPTAAAIAVNVTVVSPAAPGYLTLYAGGDPQPLTSTVSYLSGPTRATNSIVAIGAGNVAVFCGQTSGTVNMLLDVTGYFDDPANNQPPNVSAGSNLTVDIPNAAVLAGTVTDDGLPSGGLLTQMWSQVSGPGSVTFGDPTASSTTATFSAPGLYNLRLTASDSQLSNFNDILVEVSYDDIVRFLEQSTWGPTDSQISHVAAIGFNAFLTEQFSAAPSLYVQQALQPGMPPPTCTGNCLRDNYSMYPLQTAFFVNALYGPDQLRQRVAFSLHKLIVTSGVALNQPSRMEPYLNLLVSNAFGNYRDILYNVTLNPAMGDYLNMSTSTKNNPNENYAREVNQLFSVGVNLLNPDGTPQLDAQGIPIPTYTQSVVDGFSAAFTGWTYATDPAPGITDYIDPMVLKANNHDAADTKLLLNNVVLPAGQTGDQDLNDAIDNIFNHPNIGPYVCTHLIHDLVTSNPSPAYVGRVAAVFADDGTTTRGNLQAVVQAILLDPEARGAAQPNPDEGRLREPAQFAANLLRAFNARGANGTGQSDGYIDPQTKTMGQDLFNPETVFSYYPADFMLPGSTTLSAPEFGILSDSTALAYANFVNTMVFTTIPVGSNAPTGTSLDLSSLTGIAADPVKLVGRLNFLLMHNSMSAEMQASVIGAVEAVPASNALLRAQQALYLVATASQYQVQR